MSQSIARHLFVIAHSISGRIFDSFELNSIFSQFQYLQSMFYYLGIFQCFGIRIDESIFFIINRLNKVDFQYCIHCDRESPSQ